MAEPEVVEQGTEKPKGGKKKLIIIIVAAVVVIGGAVGALFGFGIIGGGSHSAEGGHEAASADPGQAAKPVDPAVVLPTVALDSFVVNLSDTDARFYLKVTVIVELTKPEIVPQLEKRKDKVMDAILMLLASKTSMQVRDSKGKLKLKQEITLRLNEILGTNAVSEVLFKEFIISQG